MDQEFIKQIKKNLETERTRLEEELKEFTTKNKHNPEDYNAEFPQLGDKEDENANEVALYSDNLTLERTLEKSLRDVVKSLERIEKGEYGICKYCGKEISKERLLARPTSSACIECKKVLTQEL
ncbi:MAG: TraR/DksA C4-type zinc finger protein [Patescibacteria group bacterium]|nr:TraR/DksA C4-type zinc finger protein [Patescibacteria group bacterium]